MIEKADQPKFWKKTFNVFLDVFFPRPCIVCGQNRGEGGAALCDLCLVHVHSIESPLCAKCGYPADIDYDYPDDDFECGECRKKSFLFDQARSFGEYEEVLKELIHFYKYQKQPDAMREVRNMLSDHFLRNEEDWSGFYVMPIPLHKKKLKERGFDQSYLLAQEVARLLNLPLLSDALKRVQPTSTQAGLNQVERAKNVRGAFEVMGEGKISGRNLLLVDDVFTTGATTNEVARIVKSAGAGKVYVFTLARVL